jgi:hypothetical protein
MIVTQYYEGDVALSNQEHPQKGHFFFIFSHPRHSSNPLIIKPIIFTHPQIYLHFHWENSHWLEGRVVL